MATQAHSKEQLLAESNRLRTILNSIGDAVIATDLAGCIVAMNPVAEALTGWEETQAHGKPLTEVFEIVNAQTGKLASNPAQRVLETGKIAGLANHTKLIAKDGAEYQIADSAAPIMDAEGKTQGVVLVFRDVTEEYTLREALQESEARFRVAQELSPDGFTILHPLRNNQGKVVDFTWVYENQTIARINDTDPDKVIGKRLLDLFPSHLGTPLFEAYCQVAETGENRVLEDVYVGEILSK
jgi:PAS domain S-box-containing protein